MDIKQFIANFREAFGDAAGLPIAFWYSDEPIATTPKIEGCFFKGLSAVRSGSPMSLNADNIGCGGGKFYTGFAPMPAHVPNFVSLKEKYKQTPEMVLDFIARSEVPVATGKYLNFARIDTLDEIAAGGRTEGDGFGDFNDFEGIEGLIFFATPDVLSGLTTWAWFDNNADDAVTTRFGSGCSTIISDPVRENRRQVESHRTCSDGRGAKEENERSEVNRSGGRRTFIGCFDVSVRPHLGLDELSFAIPMSRFREMYQTMRRSALFGTHAWEKIRDRITAVKP